MLRFVLGQLWHRRSRALALAAGVLVAALGFSLLTAASSTSQLRSVGLVKTNDRAAYDILVRPEGSTIGLERARGLVRPNYLSGIYGGISSKDYATIRRLPGVAVAAPIAMIGYVVPRVRVSVDLRGNLTDDQRQLFRVRRTWITDRRSSRIQDGDGYVYVTNSALQVPTTLVPGEPLTTAEQVGPRQLPVCEDAGLTRASSPFERRVRVSIACISREDAASDVPVGLATEWSFPLLIAAVDPAAEARLAGLADAVVAGRYLRGADTVTRFGVAGSPGLQIPVLTPSRTYDDEALLMTVDRLPSATAEQVPGAPLAGGSAERRFGNISGIRLKSTTRTAQDAYGQLLAQMRGPLENDSGIAGIWAPGPVSYRPTNGDTLHAREVTNPVRIWANPQYQNGFLPAQLTSNDVQFRRLSAHPFADSSGQLGAPRLRAVGRFDPRKLAGFSELSAVPLETYSPPEAKPADSATSRALGGKSLLPNGNLGGYLQPPPLMLTTLSAYHDFARFFPGLNRAAPISVIRVRAEGVVGVDDVSRAHVNAVAQAITDRTGLDVDITIGSSPAPQRVELAAGKFGRPALTLSEGWTKKGVAVAILRAVDRKSVALFLLILIVCAVFVGNAANAAVRARRIELGVLRALGWSTREVFTAVLAEIVAIGLAAGLVGVMLALPLSAALGLSLPASRVAAVVPIAVLVAGLAGLLPARRAARARPVDAVRPASTTARSARSPRGLLGLAFTNLLRVPGRTAGAATGLGLGIAALTILLGISSTFHGTLVGSLLGDAVALQVRAVDYVAVVTTIVLGAAGVADVLYLNIRERAGEFATLRATGWGRATVGRLITLEALGIGMVGSLTGAAAGLLSSAVLAGGTVVPLLAPAAMAVLVGMAITTFAALAPMRGLQRLPVPVLLAEE